MKTTRRLPIRSCQPGTIAQEGGRHGEGERTVTEGRGGNDEHCLIALKSHITVGLKSGLPNKISRFGLLSVFNSPYRAKHLLDFSYLVFFSTKVPSTLGVYYPPYPFQAPMPATDLLPSLSWDLSKHYTSRILPQEETGQVSSSYCPNMHSSRHTPSHFIYGTGN